MRDLVTEWLNQPVSMKSGLRDRNNRRPPHCVVARPVRLNEVRSWRPEQWVELPERAAAVVRVSMKSGLGDRNNPARTARTGS